LQMPLFMRLSSSFLLTENAVEIHLFSTN
jgi:hypothetical protein